MIGERTDLLTVVQIDAEMGFSGGEVQVFLLTEGLRALGHRVVVVCRPGSRVEAECQRRGIDHRSVAMRNYVDLPAVGRLRRVLRELSPDIVHLNTGRDTWLGGMATCFLGLPAITTRRMDRRVKRGVRTRLIYRRFVQRAAAISPGVAGALRAGGVPHARIVHISEAIDPVHIASSTAPAAVRRGLGVGFADVLVLGLGALLPRKSWEVLLQAVAKLGRDRVETLSGLQVRIAGEGRELERLTEQARGLGLNGRVRFLGRRADTGDLLRACDIFCLPSRREGLGVAALEAMGAGRPVVASAVGGLTYSVVPEETGLLVPPDDPAALAKALARLAGDAPLRARLGEGALARARARFQPEQMVESYLRLYREVLAQA